jgi:choline dehydrogenase
VDIIKLLGSAKLPFFLLRRWQLEPQQNFIEKNEVDVQDTHMRFVRFPITVFAICLPSLAAPLLRIHGVSSSSAAAASQTYDYIVVGAGLAGTTVAARLAEDPSVSVLLIEAGADNRNDSRVFDIYSYGQAFGSELDWSWPADQGRHIPGCVSNRLRLSALRIHVIVHLYLRGKTLGGSTSINGAAYTRGLDAQYDAWSTLLEPSEAKVGWNWQNLWSYMKKVCCPILPALLSNPILVM